MRQGGPYLLCVIRVWHYLPFVGRRATVGPSVVTEAFVIAMDDCDGVFLSVDIDVCDPGHAPGTGTPEPVSYTHLTLPTKA